MKYIESNGEARKINKKKTNRKKSERQSDRKGKGKQEKRKRDGGRGEGRETQREWKMLRSGQPGREMCRAPRVSVLPQFPLQWSSVLP